MSNENGAEYVEIYALLFLVLKSSRLGDYGENQNSNYKRLFTDVSFSCFGVISFLSWSENVL